MIRFSCPECEAALKVADEKAGGKITCPSCKTSVKVPAGKRKDEAEPRVRAGKAAAVAATRRRDDDYDDEDDDLPPAKSKKKSAAGLLVGIGVGAFLLVGVGVAAVVVMNRKPADTQAASGTPAPAASGLPTPGGGAAAPNLGSGSAKPAETPAKVEPAKAADAGGEQIVIDQGGEKIYDRLLQSAVFICAVKNDGSGWSGSGSLVDKENKLILTNHHVSGDGEEMLRVYFPEYEPGTRKLISPKSYYRNKLLRNDGIPAVVVAKYPKKDLALLRLTGIPQGVKALPISTTKAQPGQRVHSIGSPGTSDACWVYTSGTVRQVYRNKYVSGGDGQIHEIDAEVVETQSPVNHGDSGGPMVNDQGELVGVTQAGNFGANLLSIFIAASEAREAINSFYQRQGINRKVGDTGSDTGSLTATEVPSLVKLLRESEDVHKRALAAQALGQLGAEAKAAVPDLVNAFKDKDPTVRKRAAEALVSIGAFNKTHVPVLVRVLKEDIDPDVRTSAATALVRMGRDAKEAVPALSVSVTEDTDSKVKVCCAQALGKIGPDAKGAVGPLTAALKDSDAEVQTAAAVALGKIGPDAAAAVPALGEALKSSNRELRLNVLAAIEGLGPEAKASVPALKLVLKEKDKNLRTSALKAIGAIGPDAKDAIRNVILLFEPDKKDDENDPVRAVAIDAAAKIGKPGVPFLITALKDNDWLVRLGCVEALGQMGRDASEALTALRFRQNKDAAPKVKAAAAAAIRKINSN